MKVLRGILSLAVIGAVVACGSRSASALPGTAANQVITIEVENQEFNDATIYLYRHSSRQRLGIVTGKTSKTFSADWHLPDLQLQVSFIGGGGFTTEVLQVSPGDDLLLLITPGSQRYGIRR